MAIINSANTHQTSLLVSGQIPDFVQADHPLFVQFIESYYEFLAQANSGILTSDGTTAYYGADYATKIIPVIASTIFVFESDVKNPTAHVKITRDITLGFMSDIKDLT